MFKLALLAPLRLAVGWGLNPRLLGMTGVLMLVLLRVTVGWHFFSEGYDKVAQSSWDAKPFFANARGPVANQFRQMVWDHDGRIRLDLEKTKVHFEAFRNRAILHYRFDDAQKRQANANYLKAVEQLEWVLRDNSVNLEEYRLAADRIKKLEADRNRGAVSSLAGQTETIRNEANAKINPILSQIDLIWKNYETAQNGVANREQAGKHSLLKIDLPRNQLIDTSVLNRVVPYFDMTIGVCLLLGLFTPLAALAAAGFLGSVFLSQYPPVAGPTSSMNQLVECMACLAIAATGCGRFAGLDFVLHSIVRKFWPRTAE